MMKEETFWNIFIVQINKFFEQEIELLTVTVHRGVGRISDMGGQIIFI